MGCVVGQGAAYGSGWHRKRDFPVRDIPLKGCPKGQNGPILGAFEVWTPQEWGVTPMELFGGVNELVRGCGRLRSGLWVGVASQK